MNRGLTGLLAFAFLAGCATTATPGAVLRTERLEDDCAGAILRGELGPAAGGQVPLRVSDRCTTAHVDVVETQRSSSPHWLPTAAIAVGAGAAVTVGIFAGLSTLPKDHPANVVAGASGSSIPLVLIPGLVAGGVVAIVMSTAKVDLPNGEARVPHRSDFAFRPIAKGTLRSKEDPSLEWPVVDGKASLPIAVVARLDLRRLELDGRPIELGDESLRRSDALDSCREALESWSPGATECPAQLRRIAAAQRCSEGGWAFAVEVEQALSASLAACGAR